MPAERYTILHVTEVTGGGVEHAISQYVESLPDLDHVVLAPKDGGLTSVKHAAFIPFSRSGMARRADVRRTVDMVGPTLVHAHSSWAGLRTRMKGLGVPVVYQPHAFAFSGYASSALVRGGHRGAEKLLARRTASFLTLSEHEAQLARSLNRTVPIAQVVNISGIDANQHQTWSRPSDPSVVMVGRIVPQKDPEFYGQFAEELRAQVPSAAVSWIGDGDPEARQQLERAGVQVTGWLPQHEVALRLACTSLYVHTARYEGFPLSVLDAAAVGMPIVMRRTPSTKGIDVPQADSVGELAELSARIIEGEAMERSVGLSRALHDRHTSSTQRTSLMRAYELALVAGLADAS